MRAWVVIVLHGACCCSAFAADTAADDARARELFAERTQPSCASCHTLRDAGSTGTIGPVLDELQPDEERVSRALRDGIGVMPSFGNKLSELDIALLARYVARATRPVAPGPK